MRGTQSWLPPPSRNWRKLLLPGTDAILLGLAALGWPEITLRVLVMLSGAYLWIEGAFGTTGALRERPCHRRFAVRHIVHHTRRPAERLAAHSAGQK